MSGRYPAHLPGNNGRSWANGAGGSSTIRPDPPGVNDVVMSTPPQPPVASGHRTRKPLVGTLVQLAGTPDDASDVDALLLTIVRLVADVVDPVDYASVTAHRHGGLTTVAASAEVARAVDGAQYADDAGPCLDTVATGRPTSAPDIATTVAWPGFRAAAQRLGLQASLSVPLFAGRGVDVAALNLYSRDGAALAPLAARIRAVYDPYGPVAQEEMLRLDPGSEQLATGLTAAFAVRAVIQQAIGVVMASDNVDEDRAYLTLRLRAADQGTLLAEVARAVLADRRR
jgi:hypothetical protein